MACVQNGGGITERRSTMLLHHVLAWRNRLMFTDTLTSRHANAGVTPERRVIRVGEGTILKREWHGVPHEVEATDGGFLYQGRRWKSLSEIARAIIGTRWNGRRFFGLKGSAK